MIIVALSDIHSNTRHIPAIADEISAADAVVISGDITNFGNRKVTGRVLDALGKLNDNILAVPGNCDTKAVTEYLLGHDMMLHCKCARIGDVSFVGACKWLECPQDPDGDFASTLNYVQTLLPSEGPSILVTHQPAFGTKVDSALPGHHGGSSLIRDFIENNQPTLALSGHIHEARGSDTIGDTTLVNPGPFTNGCYAVIELDRTVKDVQFKIADH